MATIPPILVQLQADVSQLKAGLAQAEASLKSLDDNVDKSGTAFGRFSDRLKTVGAALGATFAATQVVSFFRQSISAAMEAEAAQTRLRSILLNTAGATEAQIAALGAQAEALSKVGVASKENITVTQSQLATFDLQGKTIKTLTPAILDYVTAEKGATASTDEYKQMTNGLAQALQGNFASLTRVGFVLDEETKKKIKSGSESERAAALVEVLNSTYKDFNKTLADTPEGRMVKLKQEFGDLQQEIGAALLPAFMKFSSFLTKTVIPAIEKLIKFIKDNKIEIKAFAITLGVAATAWGVYTVAVNRAKIAEAALQAVQKANPIMIIVTAVALLVAGLVKLFNTNEKFRKAVIDMAKAALKAFASIVPMVAKVAEAILKTVTGPLRAFLEALSKLPKVGKFAKSALDTINGGLDGISDMGDKAAKKANQLAASLDKVAKIGKKAGEETANAGKKNKDVWAGSKDPKGTMSKEDQKRLDKVKSLKEKATAILDDMAQARADAAERIADAELARDEKIAEAKERYAERAADIRERYEERVADASERYGEAMAEAEKRRDEAMAEARERARKADLDARKDYDKKRIEIETNYTNRVKDLEVSAQKKREEILAQGQAKLAEIVEKGRQRLRDAWQKGTAFSLKDLFGTAQETGASLIDTLKNQFAKVTAFQKELGALAGRGYQQTFIEEIAAAGPDAGMAMLAELKKLTPKQEEELQLMIVAMEDITQSGMNEVAKTLSDSSSFATAELAKMYDQAQSEITQALAEVNSELNRNVAEAKAVYESALVEAAQTRDERITEAKEALDAALAASKKRFDESVADARKTLDKALLDAKKDLDKGLEDAQKDLNKAIEDAMKAFDKAVDGINKSLDKKLQDLQSKLAAIAAQLSALGKASMAASFTTAGSALIGTITPTGAYTPPVTTTPTPRIAGESALGGYAVGQETNMVFNQTFNNVTSDPYDIHMATLTAAKYGQAITPAPAPIVTRAIGGNRYEMVAE